MAAGAVKVPLLNPVRIDSESCLLQRLLKASLALVGGGAAVGACDATDGGVAQLNQMAGCEITAVEGVVGDQIHILTDQPPIHHHHRQALEPVELVEHLLLAFATHDEQAIDPLAQHHLEVGEGGLGLTFGVTQHQVVALLEAVALHTAYHLGKEGVAGGGDQHADTVGLLHLEAAGH